MDVHTVTQPELRLLIAHVGRQKYIEVDTAKPTGFNRGANLDCRMVSFFMIRLYGAQKYSGCPERRGMLMPGGVVLYKVLLYMLSPVLSCQRCSLFLLAFIIFTTLLLIPVPHIPYLLKDHIRICLALLQCLPFLF